MFMSRVRLIATLACIVTLILVTYLLWLHSNQLSNSQQAGPADPKGDIEKITLSAMAAITKYHLDGINDCNYSPPKLRPNLTLSYKSIDIALSDEYLKCIYQAALLLPASVFARDIQSIRIVETLLLGSIPGGGTHTECAVVIAVGNAPCEYTQGSFLHEACSVLVNKYKSKFPYDEWVQLRAASPPTSRNSVRAAILLNEVGRTDECVRAGYATLYAGTSIDNDISETFELLVLRDRQFLSDLAISDVLRKKAEMIIIFMTEVFGPKYSSSYKRLLPP